VFDIKELEITYYELWSEPRVFAFVELGESDGDFLETLDGSVFKGK
jgi:hypothetical protein